MGETIMATNEAPNGGIRAHVQDTASSAYNYASHSLDRVVPPSSRQRAYDNILAFAQARPILFAFVLTQASLSFLPLLLFLTFTLLTVCFALGCAVVFSLFWIGVAFMLLVPTILVTGSNAVWGWAVGSFVVARWLYEHSPVKVRGDARMDAAGRGVEVKKDEDGIDGKVERY